MSSREEFEAWASSPAFGLSPGHFAKDEQGEYINYPAHCYWLAWEASRQALVVDLPSRSGTKYMEYFPDVEGGSFNERAYLTDFRAAIEAAGVRVKP